MTEIILLISVILLSGASAYLFGDNRRLREWNKVLRAELPDWQNKALAQRGKGILGQETKVPPLPNIGLTNYSHCVKLVEN